MAIKQNLTASLREEALELCLAIYRLTKLFSEEDVLIDKIKSLSLEILADFVYEDFHDTIKKIELLIYCFKIAKNQAWINPLNFDILEKKYNLLSNTIKENQIKPERVTLTKKKTSGESKLIGIRLSDRQKEIFEFIKDKKKFQFNTIKEKFSTFSERTIRNELNLLISQGFIKRHGSGRYGFYSVINRQ